MISAQFSGFNGVGGPPMAFPYPPSLLASMASSAGMHAAAGLNPLLGAMNPTSSVSSPAAAISNALSTSQSPAAALSSMAQAAARASASPSMAPVLGSSSDAPPSIAQTSTTTGTGSGQSRSTEPAESRVLQNQTNNQNRGSSATPAGSTNGEPASPAGSNPGQQPPPSTQKQSPTMNNGGESTTDGWSPVETTAATPSESKATSQDQVQWANIRFASGHFVFCLKTDWFDQRFF